jgi:hypothetical protein
MTEATHWEIGAVKITCHLHIDHIGWNTRWDGKGWIPTFPNARSRAFIGRILAIW